VGYEGQFGRFLLTPAAAISLLVPDKVDGTLAQRFPDESLDDGVLLLVDFDDGTWRNHVSQTSIFEPDQPVAKTLLTVAPMRVRREISRLHHIRMQQGGSIWVDLLIKL